MSETQTINKPVLLRNRTCAYCGRELANDWTKEHVIGRRFVPKGTLNNVWNLILRACKECNGHKADLEDEISAVSMMPDALGRYPEGAEESLERASRRKRTKSISRRTGRAIGDSYQGITLRSKHGPLFMELTYMGPPEANDDRITALSRFQVVAFMYWLTYDENSQQGKFVEGDFRLLNSVMQQDWGNSRQIYFMKTTANWGNRVIGQTANGFFRVALKKCPSEHCWSWALEWNRNIRSVGLLGDVQAINHVASDLPSLQFREVKNRDGEILRKRTEVPLARESDALFLFDRSHNDSA